MYCEAAETTFGEDFIDLIVTPKYHTPSQSPLNQFGFPSIYYSEENWKSIELMGFSFPLPFSFSVPLSHVVEAFCSDFFRFGCGFFVWFVCFFVGFLVFVFFFLEKE